HTDSTSLPSSTTVDQDAPSTSKSHTPTEIRSSVIPQDVGDDNLDMEVAHMGNDLLFGVAIPEVTSAQSSSMTSPHSIVQTNHSIPHHNSKWMKDHPLNNIIAKIMGYGDYQIRNVTISRVYYVDGLRYNLFFVRQFCNSDLEVAFRQHTCFIHNLDGVDLLTVSRGNNLYTLSLQDMMASFPTCLLSKASKTKS
nr:integrase, catalytic region, zinc finger, CCHC-type, peptidase aspartic, catalytic [Tanacetum cinerariifolium]